MPCSRCGGKSYLLQPPASGKPVLCPRCDVKPEMPNLVWQRTPDLSALRVVERYATLVEVNRASPSLGEAVASYVDAVHRGLNPCMLLHGSSGLGKSTMAGAIANELVRRQIVPAGQMRITTEADLLIPGENEYGRMRRLDKFFETPKFMVVDEVGRTQFPQRLNPGDCRQEMLDWVAYNSIPTVFVTNLTWAGLEGVLGSEPAKRRFARMVPEYARVDVDKRGTLSPDTTPGKAPVAV